MELATAAQQAARSAQDIDTAEEAVQAGEVQVEANRFSTRAQLTMGLDDAALDVARQV